jgi:hypothetical protein
MPEKLTCARMLNLITRSGLKTPCLNRQNAMNAYFNTGSMVNE